MQNDPTKKTVDPGRLYFTVGLPRSGKSVYCDLWVKKRDPETVQIIQDAMVSREFIIWNRVPGAKPRAIVAGDDFRHALHGHEYLVEAEGAVFTAMDLATRALLRRGHDVIVDETCTTQSTLLRYLKIDVEARPVFIDTQAEVCIERAKADGRDYLVGPIERMDAQLKALRADWDNTVAKLKRYVEFRQGLDVAV